MRKRKDLSTSYFKSSFSVCNKKFILTLPFFAKLLWQYWIRFLSVFVFYLSDLLTLKVKTFVICYVSINLLHALVSSICIEIRKFSVLNRKLVGIEIITGQSNNKDDNQCTISANGYFIIFHFPFIIFLCSTFRELTSRDVARLTSSNLSRIIMSRPINTCSYSRGNQDLTAWYFVHVPRFGWGDIL